VCVCVDGLVMRVCVWMCWICVCVWKGLGMGVFGYVCVVGLIMFVSVDG